MTGPTTTVGPQELANRTARLTLLYVVALSTVALLSILGQTLVQWSLSRQSSDSAVVNVAGRQRMLSQKLAKAAIGFQHARSPLERQQRADEIRSTLALWRRAHEGLQRGDVALNLPGRSSAEVEVLFAEIEATYQAIQSAAERLLASNHQDVSQRNGVISELVDIILASEGEFLAGMDSIVAQYEREARGRVSRLQMIERLLLVLTLVVLICEGVLVFRPAVEHVRSAASEVLKSRQELEVAKEAAESANQQKTQFLANISHELRNPLHAVLGNLELLDRTQLDSRQRGYVATADDSARSLEQLLSDLLDMSRIESGHLAINTAPFHLRDLAERCLTMHRSQAEAKGLQLGSHFVNADVWLVGDALRLRQVLVNLLGNALKFTEQGEVQLHVMRRSKADGPEKAASVRFEVIDTGIGIPPDQQSRIFDAFVQVDGSSRREFGGAGLGLAITARLVDLMGGKCGVVSELKRGSTFWVELPVEPTVAPGQPNVLDPGKEHVVSINQSMSQMAVLVVDDDEVNRRFVEESLAILGHKSYPAADGPTAILTAKQLQLDAIVLDLHLPFVDGYEVARQIRAQQQVEAPRPAIIALSAASDLSHARLENGLFDVVLSKPAGVRQIKVALDRVASMGNCSAEWSAKIPVKTTMLVEQTAAPDDRWQPVLERLQGRQELFCSLARLFLEGLPQQRAELEAALDEHRMEAVARAAHTLRGQAILFAADELGSALRKLERHAACGDRDACNRHLDEAIRRAHVLAGELQSELSRIEACETV